MGGAGDRVLIDAGTGREETRNEIELARAARGGDYAAHRHLAKQVMLRPQRPERGFIGHFDQVIELVAPAVFQFAAERFGQLRRRLGGLLRKWPGNSFRSNRRAGCT